MPRRVLVQFLTGCRGRIGVAELRRIARRVLSVEDVAPEVEVEIVLADADTVRNLNRLYRGRDEPTDVLSFAQTNAADQRESTARPGRLEGRDAVRLKATRDMGAASPPAFVEPPDFTSTLGEIIICIPVADAQAAERGLPVAGEIGHLLVHGLLHLLGYDHEESESESERMKAREDEFLAGLGYEGQFEHGH